MKDVDSFFEALYSSFLLRDLFSKIVPGIVVLAAIFFRTTLGESVAAQTIGGLGWPIVILIAGIAWIVGFAVQEIGERLRIISQHPQKYNNSDVRYGLRIDFWKVATTLETHQAERYAVIKEACGNGATAIFVAVCVITGRSLIARDIDLPSISMLAELLLVFALLLRANRSHVKKHYEFMERVKG